MNSKYPAEEQALPSLSCQRAAIHIRALERIKTLGHDKLKEALGGLANKKSQYFLEGSARWAKRIYTSKILKTNLLIPNKWRIVCK